MNRIGIWYYIKNYKFNSIFLKNFLLIVLLIVLPLVALSGAVYYFYSTIMEKEISEINNNSLSRVKDITEILIRETTQTSYRLMFHQEFKSFFMYPASLVDLNGEEVEYKHFNDITENISMNTAGSDIIKSIYVYSEKNGMVISNLGTTVLDEFYDNSWYEGYKEKKDSQYRWVEARRVRSYSGNGVYDNLISVITTVRLANNMSQGAIVMNIDGDKFGNIIYSDGNKNQENIFITDENGVIIYNKDHAMINKYFFKLQEYKAFSTASMKSPQIKEISGKKVAVSWIKSTANNWNFISVLPLSLYNQRARYLQVFMMVVVCLCLIMAVTMSFFTSIRLFKPISDIMSVVERPEEWLQKKQVKLEPNNELKHIVKNIITNFDQSKKMEEELARRLLLVKKAQEIALQSQINPHFLYNTLETINWMAIGLSNGENNVSRAIAILSDLLRLSLETGDKLIPFGLELEHARRYIEIQKLRYSEIFDVIWDIDPKLYDFKVVKITLQPLIENAIYHGIKPSKKKASILIGSSLGEDSVIIEVFDNGVGMDNSKVDLLNSNLSKDYISEDQNIGLKNVNQRIKLIFGEQYGITVESSRGEWTKVKVIIPLVK